jgi:hypothetical protein
LHLLSCRDQKHPAIKIIILFEQFKAAKTEEESYIGENHILYKNSRRDFCIPGYFFKDPGGGKDFGNQSRPGLDTFFSISAVPQVFWPFDRPAENPKFTPI